MTRRTPAEQLLPAGWREAHGVVAMEVQALGESGASVWRLRRECAEDLFLKSEPVAALAELPGEVSRLRWMAGQGMSAPRVIDAATEQGRHWLLMTAVSGQSLAESTKRAPAATVALMAEALRQLHQRPVGECPFDHALAARVRLAQARITAGLVDEADFDEEQLGRTASDVFADLLAARPAKEDRVVTHGDACLPNVMAEGTRFSGFTRLWPPGCGRPLAGLGVGNPGYRR